MIAIRIVSGPHEGKERSVEEGKFEGVEILPVPLLDQLFELGSRWEIDYSSASADEAFEWGRADLVVRIVRALFEGRPVFFDGVEYRANTADEVPAVSGRIEDAIVNSGHNVTLGGGDERGVSIATGAP